jgi:uncharacterized membrane protein
MIEVRAQATIARPASEVFDFVADMSNNPQWQKGMQSCVWTSEEPIGVDSTYDQIAGFLGKEIRTSFKVTEFEPGTHIRIESTSGPLQLNIIRSVEADGPDASIVSAVIRGDSSGLFKIADPLMKIMVNRNVQADYRRLAQLLND